MIMAKMDGKPEGFDAAQFRPVWRHCAAYTPAAF